MNYLSFILRIVAILSAITAGTLYFMLAGKLEKTETQLSQARTELQTLIDKNESADLEITELEKALASNEKLVDETKVQAEEAKAELVAEMQESQLKQTNLIEAQKKISQLEETNKRLRQELINAENLAASASKESVIAQLSERVEELTTANTKLREKGRSPDTSVDGETDDTTSFTLSDAQKLSADEISAIEEETQVASFSIPNGIIVLNTNETLNLKPATTLTLIKDTATLAQIKVININDSLAIANILPGASLDKLAKGDTVKILR